MGLNGTGYGLIESTWLDIQLRGTIGWIYKVQSMEGMERMESGLILTYGTVSPIHTVLYQRAMRAITEANRGWLRTENDMYSTVRTYIKTEL